MYVCGEAGSTALHQAVILRRTARVNNEWSAAAALTKARDQQSSKLCGRAAVNLGVAL